MQHFYNRLQGLHYRQSVLDACPDEGACYSLGAVQLIEPQG